ncbi:MAG: LysM peptidoglycan-binding domain-containing protein [Bacteriovoracia bacterium]
MRLRLGLGILFLSMMTACSSGGSGGTDGSPETAGEIIQEADTANIDIVNPGTQEIPATDNQETQLTQTPESPVAQQPEAVPYQAPATSGDVGMYTVQRGDTLMKIAFSVYGDVSQWSSLYELNKDSIGNANRLEVGSTIKYQKPVSEPVIDRNGEPYLIRNGDTLGSIAQQIYAQRSKWKKLYENNRQLIKDPNKIYAGFYLYYQMTEEEKQFADQAHSTLGSTSTGTTDDSFFNSGSQPTDTQQDNSQTNDSTNTPTDVSASNAKKSGGLNALGKLATGSSSRAPASK